MQKRFKYSSVSRSLRVFLGGGGIDASDTGKNIILISARKMLLKYG